MVSEGYRLQWTTFHTNALYYLDTKHGRLSFSCESGKIHQISQMPLHKPFQETEEQGNIPEIEHAVSHVTDPM